MVEIVKARNTRSLQKTRSPGQVVREVDAARPSKVLRAKTSEGGGGLDAASCGLQLPIGAMEL